ncbi:ABC transporter ATP-binding protein [Roseicyclus mahoneyensis]|uniref:Energy-coupling factor transport system ATP-binding protein n=1 Tax=Roseicyclus mahoneyensis TaxID=164332 RepID=A0A316H237_9RHOB|nr:ATP-binding cassette domain-containing protein [Roseicyclus mahoneyensis]PWK61421.1 energy-coupling factor transport system ATP-binding protein [Roseicyclus mahoneyensis]
MFDALAYDRVALRHDGAATDAVGPVSLTLHGEERVLLLGPSGAGKSTLLQAATGLMPASIPGRRRGDIYLNGQLVDSRRPADWADTCSYLFQDAGQTLAGFTVRDEIAFGPENRGIAPAQMPALIAKAMARAAIPASWDDRRITTLSGGERQLVAIAALLAQGAPITLADEPMASLAPAAARRMADLLLAPGATTLVVEHKPGPILARSDRCVAIGRTGRVIADGVPADIFPAQAEVLAKEGISLPLGIRLHLAFPDLIGPFGVLDKWRTSPPAARVRTLRDALLPAPIPPGDIIVTLSDVACAPAFGPVVLRDLSLALRAGEVVAIVGPNGVGKSTLAACLAGLLPPRGGRRKGPAGAMAFQNPEAHFSRESVRAELETVTEDGAGVARILGRWGLEHVAHQHPFTLSQGQKRRLALALLSETDRWPVLILDEPTAGLDGAAEAALGAHIRTLARAGRAIGVITHDLDFALAVADRALLLDRGGLRFDGPCATLMRDPLRLAEAGLLPPTAAPLLDWLERAC